MKALHDSQAIHAIHSRLRQFENALNSQNLTQLTGLFSENAWIIDANQYLYQSISNEGLITLCHPFKDHYCLLVVDYVLGLPESFGYVTIKVRIRYNNIEFQSNGNLIMIFRYDHSPGDWYIQLLQYIAQRASTTKY